MDHDTIAATAMLLGSIGTLIAAGAMTLMKRLDR